MCSEQGLAHHRYRAGLQLLSARSEDLRRARGRLVHLRKPPRCWLIWMDSHCANLVHKHLAKPRLQPVFYESQAGDQEEPKKISPGPQGVWVAQWLKGPPLDIGAGGDLRVASSSPMSGSTLGVDPAEDSLSPLPLASYPHSKKIKIIKSNSFSFAREEGPAVAALWADAIRTFR